MNKYVCVVVVFCCAVLFQGCNTLKGAGTGLKTTGVGIKDGFVKDWQEAQKVDDWMREHMW